MQYCNRESANGKSVRKSSKQNQTIHEKKGKNAPPKTHEVKPRAPGLNTGQQT
jgi:hypothetical protein